MQKRGQITLFVILGMIVIGAVALGFYLRQQTASKEVAEEAAGLSTLPPDLAELREEIDGCAKLVSDEALYLVGQQGGYSLAPDDAIVSGDYSIALGVASGARTLASEDTLKSEIASYVESFLPECVNYASYQDLEIFDQPAETSVNLNDEKTDLKIEYKVTAQKDGNTYNLFEPYEVELPLRVKKVYESSSKIADEIASSPKDFDVAKVLSYGMDVDVNNLGNGFMVILVKDKKHDMEKNYEFQFGVAL